MQNIKVHRKNIFKILFAIFVYIVLVNLIKIDQIRSIDDSAYDKLVVDFINVYEDNFESLNTKTPSKVNVFLIEDQYLKDYNLVKYGNYFPRESMSSIVESLNYSIEEMQSPPKAVFIDFDFHYTELPFGRKLSVNDIKLVKELLILAKSTVVLIPKNEKFHFIENYLQQNDLNIKNIKFVSPNFRVTDDSISRRFQPYNIIDEKIYLHADLVLYLIENNLCSSLDQLDNIVKHKESIEVCNHKINKFDIVADRFMAKLTLEHLNNDYSYGSTLWDKNNTYQTIRSVSTLVEDSIVAESMQDSIIMIGAKFQGNNDLFIIENNFAASPIQLSGILLHLSTLNTLNYFHGQLKILDIKISIFLIFIVFMIFIYIEKYLKIDTEEEKNELFIEKIIKKLKSFIIFFSISLVFFFISLAILLHYHYWFNWLAPVVAYEFYDVIVVVYLIIVEFFSTKARKI